MSIDASAILQFLALAVLSWLLKTAVSHGKSIVAIDTRLASIDQSLKSLNGKAGG